MDYDVVVVGAGPVGLHAALKAAVLNHRVLVVDKGARFSRVSQAPSIANVPGSPGITGPDLLRRGREDLRRFRDISGKDLVDVLDGTEATDAWREGDGYRLALRREDGTRLEAAGRVLVLATGVVDRKPGVERFHARGHQTVAPYLHRGRVGYCLLCEGWDLAGKRIGVVGSSAESAQVAADVARQFGGEVTLLTDGAPVEGGHDELRKGRVEVVERAFARLEEGGDHVRVAFEDGGGLAFDKVLFSLGWYKVNNELAVRLGARTTPEGYVLTDEDCEALDARGEPIRGLFAVGDLRAGKWKQIVVGWGDAETAVIAAYAYRLPCVADEHEDPAMRGRETRAAGP